MIRTARPAHWHAWLATVALASPALAQEQPPPEDTARAEEIIVTGQRSTTVASKTASVGILGDRGLLDTPFAIDGYGRALIEDSLALTLSDVLKNDPSVTVTRARGTFSDTVNVRGFPIGGGNLLYDGLPSSISGGANYQLEAIERVDLLQGPAAFFYGAAGFGGVGGAVNYVPKRAPKNRDVADVEAQFIEPGYIYGRIDVSHRFGANGEFGARFNGAYGDGAQLIDNTDTQRIVADLALDYSTNDGSFSLFADVAYVRNYMGGYQNSLALGSLAQLPVIPAAPGGRNTLSQPWIFYPTELTIGTVKAQWRFAPAWTFTVGAGISNLLRETRPSPGSPTLINAAGDIRIAPSFALGTNSDTKAVTGQISGAFATGFLRHEVVVAADFFANDFEGSPSVFLTNPAAGSGGFFTSNIYNPVLFPAPVFPSTTGQIRTTSDSQGYGFAVSDIIALGDSGVSLLAGGRYSHYRINQFSVTTGAFTSGFDDGRFNPVAALIWKPSDDSILYANYSEAFERGGAAPVGTTNQNESLPPLKTSSMELGGKAVVAGLTLQAAVFRIEKGLEYTRPSSVAGQPGTYVADGRQVHTGGEIQLSGSPVAGVVITGGAMLLDAEVRNLADPTFTGNRPIGVPRFQGTLYVDWSVKGVEGLGFNAGLYHYSRQYAELSNARSIPAWTRLDLGARYAFTLGDTRLTARVAVENVTDKAYWSGFNGTALSAGAPRTAKFSLTASF